MKQPEIDKLMDFMLDLKDDGATLEKVKMKKNYYQKLNQEHKDAIDTSDDATSILGVPIEIDDSIKHNYEVIF